MDNCSENDTDRIPAGGFGIGRWALMNALGATSVLSPYDSVDGVKLEICYTRRLTNGSRALVKAVARGIQSHQEPQRTAEGLGGTYFFRNEQGRRVGIFKPCDEEPMAPFNPRGFVGRRLGDPGLKPTVRVGEAALREVAAYLLDWDRFAGVPHTVLVHASHPKFHNSSASQLQGNYAGCTRHPGEVELSYSSVSRSCPSVGGKVLGLKMGSLQEFVSHICDTSEMGTSKFNTRNVHRIGILDIRLYNTDRHAGNMLVRSRVASSECARGLARLEEEQFELVPIDHGFCLPEALEPPYFEWLHWPQAMLPFDEEELDYIARLDIEADKMLLRQELPVLRVECLRTLEVATILLKKCAKAGLCLHEIGEVMSRPLVGIDKEHSDLEKICVAAKRELQECFTCYDHAGAGEAFFDDFDIMTGLTAKESEELSFCVDDINELELTAVCQPYKINSFLAQRSTSGNNRRLDSPELGIGPIDAGSKLSANNSNQLPESCCIQELRRGGFSDKKRSASLQLPSSYLPGRRTMLGTPLCRRKLLMQQLISPKQCLHPQTYPPLVEGAAPSSANDVFSGMDDNQWEFFIDLVKGYIDRALQRGCWRLHAGKQGKYRSTQSSVGLSFSRF